MKTSLSILLLIVLLPVFSKSESNYEKAMRNAQKNLNQAASVSDFQEAANQFDRIAGVETNNWLPLYHAAYASVMMAAMEQDPQKKDVYLDAAQQKLDKVENMEHDATERLALEGFLVMIRMSIDPARGAELGQKCGMIVNQAYAVNNQNPRAVLMLAQFNLGVAQYMGEDVSEACAMLDEVLQLLDQPQVELATQFMPSWGRDISLEMKKQCR